MKKIYLFIVVAITGITTLQAQKTLTSKKVNWGIKTGINFSNLRVSNGMDSHWKNGLAVGTFFRIKAGKIIQVQPEFLYSSMGGEVTDGNGTNKVRLNYFSLLVLAKYQWKNKLAFMAGPQIDLLVQAKRKSSSDQISKVTANYKESSFNVTGGLEYWPCHCIGVSARYIYGLNNVNAIGNTELKNQGIQIMAAIKL